MKIVLLLMHIQISIKIETPSTKLSFGDDNEQYF